MRTHNWKLYLFTAIIIFGTLAALPNLFTDEQLEHYPSWLPKTQFTLGLDLKGGSHIVLEVDEKALLKERVENLYNDIRAAVRTARVPVQGVRLNGESIIVTPAPNTDKAALMKALQGLNEPVGESALSAFNTGPMELSITENGAGALVVKMTEEGIHHRILAATTQSLEIVRQRIDQIGVAEPTIQRVGNSRILVQLPGLQDPSHVKELLGSTAKMTFHFLDDSFQYGGSNARPGPGVTMMPDVNGTTMYPILNRVIIGGDRLVDAKASFEQQTGQPVVSFRFDRIGTRAFAKITTENVNRPFAIVLDGKVLSAPVIREPITGGSGQISGNFNVQEATMLSALLRAGALPAPLTVVEERTVGPDLGSDAIEMGIKTGIAGFMLVFIFIIVLYGWWGLIANFALALNVVLTLGVLSLIGATLTLPGIAGIILGIGLAVDANVLINERIREESKRGISAMAALDTGFKRAYSTIIDSNATALIATLILFQFGTGSVKGFAITMALGITISLFTAVSVVRVIMEEIVRRKKVKRMNIRPLFPLFPQETNINFMKARMFGIGVSMVLSVASIILFIKPGLNYGIDFKGGIQIEITSEEPLDIATYREALQNLNIGEVALQDFGENSILVRTERHAETDNSQQAEVNEVKKAIESVNSNIQFARVEVVGPKVSSELALSGILAVVLASIAMLFYIWWRFEWPFAVGAIATLVLDTTKTIGFFALTGLDFNLTAIAALLTLIGYSVNDKVVVYDRMRENMQNNPTMPLRTVIDKSINQTLARSIYTSATTFFAMLPMAIWGGSAVESFAIPMIFGIVIAGSSSIFIAAPILLFLGDWRLKHKQKQEAAAHANNVTQAAEEV